MSYKSINFSETAIWVKAEGIPFILSTEEFTHNILSHAGGVLHMDEESHKPGPKRYMRALVWIKLSKPLVPGCYIEYEPGNMLWIDFRYEGVFRFCNKCGRIGHTMNECNKSREMAEQDFNGVIRAHSNAREIVFGKVTPHCTQIKLRDYQIPLFSEQL
ncbi:hypothetical protein RDABS01_013343 [Bienertia sinuspersici]